MSLKKIPVIVILTIGYKLMLSPPNPPPLDHEIIPSTVIDVNRLRKYRLTLGHVRLQNNNPLLLINSIRFSKRWQLRLK